MEFVLLLVAVAAWLIVRKADQDEAGRASERQEREIERLREQVQALQRKVFSAPPEVAFPAPISPVSPLPPRPLALSVAPARVEEAAAVPATFTPPLQPSVMAAMPTAPPPPPFGATAQEQMEPRRSLEQTLGANWLNRLGIVLLVFGVALYLAYEVTHFGALGKVLTAFAVSGGLLGGGLWLERRERYRMLGRAGIGGGWALGFLTTYAMFYFPATKLLGAEWVDLVLLFGVGLAMVGHSLRYRSQVVTGIAFLLAFSTVTISQVTVYSLLASAVLALGLEVVCVREAWYGLELAGVVAAYGNHFLWLDRTLGQFGGPGHAFPLWGESTGVLLLFWAIFRAGYCVRRPVDETGEGLSGLVALVNSAGILGLMKYQSFHPEWGFRALLGLGAVEMGLAFAMRGRRRPAFAVLVTIASVLLVAAVPLRYGGATWPFVWVLEGEALFLCGWMLRERVMRWLGVVTHLLVVGQMLALHGEIVFSARAAGAGRIAAVFFCLATAMWGNAEWLGRGEADSEMFGSALKMSSGLAAVCAGMGMWILVPGWGLALVWAGLALGLVEAGLRFRSVMLRMEAYGVLLAALVRLLAVNFTSGGTAGFGDVRLWAGTGLVGACVLMHERLKAGGEDAPEGARVAGAVMWCASALVSSLLYMELPEGWLAAGWAGFGLGLAGFCLVRDGGRVRSKALLLAGMAAVRGLVVNLGAGWDGSGGVNWGADWGRLAFFCAVGLLATGVPVGVLLRKRVLPEGRASVFVEVLRRPEQVFFFAAFALLVAWVPVDFHHGMLTMVWSGLGVAVFLVALGAGERSFRLAGLGLLLLGVAKLLVMDVWGLAATERYLLLIGVGIALLVVSFLYSRFGERLKEYL